MKNQKTHPPRLADQLLEWYCGHASIEDLQGDAHEIFFRNLRTMSKRRAKINYWKHVLSLAFSYTIRKRKKKASYYYLSSSTFHPAMLKNFLVVAGRNLVRHKFFTTLNVLGLAIGMSISLLLIAMLSFLWTYDEFHVNKDSIYRVISISKDGDGNREFASAPAIVAENLKHEFSDIESVVRISKFSANVAREGSEIPVRGYFADPEFFTLFSFPLMKGKGGVTFKNPNMALITQHAATKLFGEEDPIGKVIDLSNIGSVEISGLLQDPPKNSHMQFEVLLPHQLLLSLPQNQTILGQDEFWPFRNSYLYLLVSDHGSIDQLEKLINKIPASLYSDKENYALLFELQALKDIAPGRELINQIGPDWDYPALTIFMVLTLLILLPACFNYANISISRALKRMKEIGLRKTLGGQQRQIFLQFMMETIIITLIALFLSFYIFTLIRDEFVSMIVSAESLDLTPDLRTIGGFLLFAVLVGVIAGIVPAIYFSRLNPIQALKNKPIGRKLASFNFRKVLIVFQFALSLGFIMGVVVVMNQYRYSLNYDFGFDQENVLDIELQNINPQIFKNEFTKLAAVQSISMSSGIAGASGGQRVWVKNEAADSIEVAQMFVDHQYISNMNLKLLAGKNFADNRISHKAVIVNEEFLKDFHIPNAMEAIDQTYFIDKNTSVTVIGVIKNFHYTDLRSPIQSFFFRFDPEQFQFANIRVASPDMTSTLSDMEETWRKIGEEKKFMARFFDDEIKEAYSFYFAMVKICGFLGFLAISISCLGLLGMVVFTVESRMKEVGVRKVMGASVWNITLALSKDFVKLMFIAAIIAIPIAYTFFDKVYLSMQQFYHINIGAFEIILSLIIVLLLGLTTILSQTVKAAKVNPVDTLRYE